MSEFTLLAAGWAFFMASLHTAQRLKPVLTAVLGFFAWMTTMLPKRLLSPVAEFAADDWLFLVGGVIFVGGPLVVFLISKCNRRK